MDQVKIGAFIAELRKAHNMTQAQLAEVLGVSDKSVSKWERGVCMPDVSLYQELCAALEISINELFAGEKIEVSRLQEQSEHNLLDLIKAKLHDQKRSRNVIGTLVAAVAIVALVAAMAIQSLFASGYFDNNYVRGLGINSHERTMMETISLGLDYMDVSMLEYKVDGDYRSVQFVTSVYNGSKKIGSEKEFTYYLEEGVHEGMIFISHGSYDSRIGISIGDAAGGTGSANIELLPDVFPAVTTESESDLEIGLSSSSSVLCQASVEDEKNINLLCLELSRNEELVGGDIENIEEQLKSGEIPEDQYTIVVSCKFTRL